MGLRAILDHMTATTAPLSGRRAQAARNDQRIRDAARVVFTADPDAPIAAVAQRAAPGVGDTPLLFEHLQAVRVGAPPRPSQLRPRYLTLFLAALHAPSAAPLPAPPPSWDEIRRRYNA